MLARWGDVVVETNGLSGRVVAGAQPFFVVYGRLMAVGAQDQARETDAEIVEGRLYVGGCGTVNRPPRMWTDWCRHA